MQRIAIIGGGVTGLGAAWALSQEHGVVVYESESRLGGHANTAEVMDGEHAVPVDTAFVTYNTANYPNLVRLFEHLGVPTEPSDMSFSWSLGGGGVEFGSRARAFLAQPANWARPAHWRMLLDYRRFCAEAPAILSTGSREPLGAYLERNGYGPGFRHDLLVPLIASVWSSDTSAMLEFPAATMIGFLQNHAVLQLGERQRWRTVTGGSHEYVKRLSATFLDGVRLSTPVASVERDEDGVTVRDTHGGVDRYDHVVFATHADTTLAALGTGATHQERALLGAFRFQRNVAVLHHDHSLMPRGRAVWSAWNYLTAADSGQARPGAAVSVTYWMNRLQSLPTRTPVFVSLNPLKEPRREVARFSYSHPLFDRKAIDAQGLLGDIQGRRRTWFAGAWTGSGFHEDGLRSGLEVAAALGSPAPWGVVPKPTLAAVS